MTTEKAYQLGQEAREQNKVASQSVEFLAGIKGMVNGQSLPYLKAFNNGWHDKHIELTNI